MVGQDTAYCVYIIASARRTIYTGVTSKLLGRIWEHKVGRYMGFSYKYNCTRLVYYEALSDPLEAIAREKQIKGWDRKKKLALINKENADWLDLAESWFDKDDLAVDSERFRQLRATQAGGEPKADDRDD